MSLEIGVIFDWDGVVIDSSEHHERSWELLAEEGGFALPPDHFKKGFGMKNELIIPTLLNWTQEPTEIERLSLRKEALYRDVVRDIGIAPLPGVEAFLQSLQDAQIPFVIGSSTHRENIETGLEITGLKQYFVEITSAEDVSHGKPDPEVFLKAAGKIRRAPEVCVVIEDAFVGIEAARRAGMRVIAVATTNPLSDLIDKADIAVQSLEEIDAQKCQQLFG